jgi:zinc protease
MLYLRPFALILQAKQQFIKFKRMKTIKSTLYKVFVITLFTMNIACSKKEEAKYTSKTATDSNGFTYEYVTNDPLGVRIYTLENGLKVYLSVNKDEPRIQTLVAVRAGSTYDPKETTGLAHYLEHMVFKGTERIGTSNWEEEKVLLEEIAALYEKHKNTENADEKKRIYKQIDSVSNEASKFAIPNEYDKMVSSIGAKGTNAFTSNEQTVYLNDIPSNELEKWIKLERERFGSLVLRLFHTELEAVYEEFNMSQDNDRRKIFSNILSGLFPTHPYGTQTTIGEGEHLKNPSMINIRNYWETYYRPNNMAIILSGDIDPDATIKLIAAQWSDLTPNNNIAKPSFEKQKAIEKPIHTDVYGPDAESVTLAYRINGIHSTDNEIARVTDIILSNSQAGLIDLNLVQKQKVISAYSFANFMDEYGMFMIAATPRQGQSLEEARDLLLEQVELLKKGEFEDWIVEASINELRVNEMRRQESNYRAYTMKDAFIHNIPWIDFVGFTDKCAKISKQDVVNFANEKFGDNYVAVYKRTGKDTSVMKVDKPAITPVQLNREKQSEFLIEFNAMPSQEIKPVFVDFNSELKRGKLQSGIEMYYVTNPSNELFSLYYIFDMGRFHDPKLALAVEYLPYLGTSKYTPEEIQKEFFKLGVKLGVYVSERRCYVYLDGLEATAKQAIELLEHLLADAQVNSEAYANLVDDIIKKRENSKLNKFQIRGNLVSFGKFGDDSPAKFIIPEAELKSLNPAELVAKINELPTYKHYAMYYGRNTMDNAIALLNETHKTPASLKEIPAEKQFVQQSTDRGEVFLVHYDQVQTDISILARDVEFDAKLMGIAQLFNEFFGSGLSSIVFQEIRESKGLAYSSYAQYSMPALKGEYNYLNAFIGTQFDKMDEALSVMLDILTNMPEAEKQFESSKEAILKKIDSERIMKTRIFWTYRNNLDRGIDYDIRKDVYETVKNADLDDMKNFFNTHIKGKEYTLMVVGNRDQIDKKALAKYGKITELSLEDIFGY